MPELSLHDLELNPELKKILEEQTRQIIEECFFTEIPELPCPDKPSTAAEKIIFVPVKEDNDCV